MVSIKYINLRVRSHVPGLVKSVIEYPWMNIILSGKLEFIVNDCPVMLTERHIAYFKTGDTVERREQETDCHYISIRFTTTDDDSNIDLQVPILSERQDTLVSLLQSYYFGTELGESENRHAANRILELIIQELRATCGQTETNRRVIEIRNYVLRHFGEGIRTQSVARYFALHPSYCNTLYKDATGETIGQLIERVRIEHASSRLMYSQLSVSEIAQECGFKDLYYFSRWFRKHTRISPTEYRRQGREAPRLSLESAGP